MAVTASSPGPYAPASAILDVIKRYRNHSLPSPFDAELLGRVGVSDSLIPRTLQALKILELIGEDGKPTETLETLRRSPEPEFPSQLAAWVRSVYSDVLNLTEPDDDEGKIRDAFRTYNPVGQQARMVSLFTGLCTAAGLRSGDQPKESRPRAQTRKQALPKTIAALKRSTGSKARNTSEFGGVPPALAGLLTSLPPDGGSWTAVEREKFKTAFASLLDFCFEIKDDEGGDE